MKVKVKTLKGTHFEIEVNIKDTVADVKKNIETVQGLDVYPAARQMLIHKGKVLQDDTTMEENEVSDNSFIVVMLSMATNTRPTPPPAPAAPPPPHPPSSTTNPPYNQTATHLVDQVNPPSVIHRIPESSHGLPPLAGAAPPPAVNPPQATQQPPASPSAPNSNPLNLFPHDLPARNFDLIGFMRNSREFHARRSNVRADPWLLQTIFQHMWNFNQRVARLIYEHQAEVLRLIFEPVEGEEDGFGQPSSGASESFTVTTEDMDAMDRLEAMGFNRLLVWQAYFACNKNEELAANYLLDHMREFEE